MGQVPLARLWACLVALKKDFRIKVIAVDIVGSVLFGGTSGPREIPGIGASTVPPLLSPMKLMMSFM